MWSGKTSVFKALGLTSSKKDNGSKKRSKDKGDRTIDEDKGERTNDEDKGERTNDEDSGPNEAHAKLSQKKWKERETRMKFDRSVGQSDGQLVSGL